jgi:hypothetical protein
VLGWKGPVRVSRGYKEREELELPIASQSDSPEALLRALGYEVVHAIDRQVEIYRLEGATLRVETYPRMDALLEVEGEPDAIERAIGVTGIPRSEFTADALSDFVSRFLARTGQTPVLARDKPADATPPVP